MQIENQFQVAASPDRVYAFLLDVNRVVTCMPGAELAEVVDPTTFKGKVKIKVGPITVSYNGTARIADRDDANRAATLQADGRETTGPGSARASARMSVEDAGDGTSTVPLSISTVSSGSSLATVSPSAFSHSATVPSSMVRPSTGIVTGVATAAQRSLFTSARAAATRSSIWGKAAVSSTALYGTGTSRAQTRSGGASR